MISRGITVLCLVSLTVGATYSMGEDMPIPETALTAASDEYIEYIEEPEIDALQGAYPEDSFREEDFFVDDHSGDEDSGDEDPEGKDPGDEYPEDEYPEDAFFEDDAPDEYIEEMFSEPDMAEEEMYTDIEQDIPGQEETIVFEPALSAADPALSGQCGESVFWYVEGNRLFICGDGAMYDYSLQEPAPWSVLAESIRSISVETGVTGIGAYAFGGLYLAEEISFPTTLCGIGNNAFVGCRGDLLD